MVNLEPERPGQDSRVRAKRWIDWGPFEDPSAFGQVGDLKAELQHLDHHVGTNCYLARSDVASALSHRPRRRHRDRACVLGLRADRWRVPDPNRRSTQRRRWSMPVTSTISTPRSRGRSSTTHVARIVRKWLVSRSQRPTSAYSAQREPTAPVTPTSRSQT